MTKKLLTIQNKYSLTDEEMKELIPISGKNNKYIDWLCKSYKSIMQTGEDFNTACNRLSNIIIRFEKLNKSLKNKDINQYVYGELEAEIESLGKTKAEIKASEANTIYKDDNLIVMHPTTFESHKMYGANTRWCTTGSDLYYYNSNNHIKYCANGISYALVFIAINQKTSKKNAIVIGGSLLKDSNYKSHNFIIYNEQNYGVYMPGFSSPKYIEFINLANKNKKQKDFIKNYNINDFFTDGDGLFSVSQSFENAIKAIFTYLFEISNDIQLINNCDKNHFNLISKPTIITAIYNLDSAVDILQKLKTFSPLEIFNGNLVKNLHDKDCSFVKLKKDAKTKKSTPKVDAKTKKSTTKVDDKLVQLENLKQCDCLKFNEINFLNNMLVELNDAKGKSITTDYYDLFTLILNDKINLIKNIKANRKASVERLLSKDSENNLSLLMSNINLTRDEALFLQCNSASKAVKKKCFDMFKISDDLASEIIMLKNIKSLEYFEGGVK
jgi:hypothetical protein